jgi:hypothetical protein
MRAECILRNGPSPKVVVGGDTVEGFSTVPEHGPYPLGSAQDYADGKSQLFPGEGGMAILELDVPISVVALAVQPGGEIWFGIGYGLEELLKAWSRLSKRIVVP